MTDAGTALLETLYEQLAQEYGEDRTGVHVSDIVLCPRETVFRRLSKKTITKTELSFFTSGEAIGSAIQALALKKDQYKAEYEVKLDGLEAHVDLYDSVDNIPIECKSYNGADMDQPKSHYVAQLKAYMAMLNASKGIILVQLLQHFRSKKGSEPFKTWVITMTPDELKAERIRITTEAANLAIALNKSDPGLARHVLNDEETNWKCNYCKFKRECQSIEAKK